MIARDPYQRRLYEQRLKIQMDEDARLQAAASEGEARGERRGEAIGRVRLLQQLIGLPVATSESLKEQSLAELASLESDLQRQLRERG